MARNNPNEYFSGHKAFHTAHKVDIKWAMLLVDVWERVVCVMVFTPRNEFNCKKSNEMMKKIYFERKQRGDRIFACGIKLGVTSFSRLWSWVGTLKMKFIENRFFPSQFEITNCVGWSDIICHIFIIIWYTSFVNFPSFSHVKTENDMDYRISI